MQGVIGNGGAAAFVLIGIALAALGAAYAAAGVAADRAIAKRQEKRPRSAAATVVCVKETTPGAYERVYEFETDDGGKTRATSGVCVGRRKAAASKGKKTVVSYDPENPDDIFVAEEWATARKTCAAAFMFGAALFAIGFTAAALGILKAVW